MAWSFVAHRGSATSTDTGTTIVVSPSAQLAAGSCIIARGACANTAVAGGQTDVLSVADSKGNTWTKIYEESRANILSSALWVSVLATAIETTDTVTMTGPTDTSTRLIGLVEFSIEAGATVEVTGANGANANTTTPTVTVTGLTSAEYMFVGSLTHNGGGSAFTQDADYANDSQISPAVNALRSSRFGNRLLTATEDTYNPTLQFARGLAIILGALKEVPAAGGVGTNILRVTILQGSILEGMIVH